MSMIREHATKAIWTQIDRDFEDLQIIPCPICVGRGLFLSDCAECHGCGKTTIFPSLEDQLPARE